MKKGIILFLFFFIFVLSVGLYADAATFTANDMEYDTANSSNSGSNSGLKWYLFSDGMLYIEGNQYSSLFYPTDLEISSVQFMYLDFVAGTSLEKFFSKQRNQYVDDYNHFTNVKKVYIGENFDSSQTKYFNYLFWGMRSLEKIDISNMDTSGATDLTGLFAECSHLLKIDFSKNDLSQVSKLDSLASECIGLQEVDFSACNLENVNGMRNLFYGCSSLSKVSFDNIMAPKKLMDLENLFSGCKALKEIDISAIDTKNIVDFSDMFKDCAALATIDLSGFDTSSAKNLSGMFSGCISMTDIDVSNFVTSNVSSINSMFANCSALEHIDISSFDSKSLTDAACLFKDCHKLRSISMFKTNTPNLDRVNQMFENCYRLESIDLSSFNFDKVVYLGYLFYNCCDLIEINLGEFSTRAVGTSQYTDTNKLMNKNVFHNNENLEKIAIKKTSISSSDVKISLPRANTIMDKAGHSIVAKYSAFDPSMNSNSEIVLYHPHKIEYGGVFTYDNCVNYDYFTCDSPFEFKEPDFTGYSLISWKETGTDEVVYSTDDLKNKKENASIYASWEVTNHVINYKLDGGTNSLSNSATHTYFEDFKLEDPTKNGFIFLGWSYDSFTSDLNRYITKIEKGIDSEVTIYANWKLRKNAITYELSRGVNNSNNPTYFYVTDEDIPLFTPTKKGATFVGWNYNGTIIDAIKSGTYGDIKLKAIWKYDKYSISYHLDGGTNSPKNKSEYTVDDYIQFSNPTKQYYDFAGWYTDSLFTNRIYYIGNDTQISYDLYAKWVPTEYRISYNDCGTLPDNTVYSYNIESDDVILPTPCKNGYKFIGWHQNKSLNDDRISTIKAKNCSPYSLYGEWEIIDYSIKYYLFDGINSSYNPILYNVQTDTFSLKNPTKKGYTFDGWYLDDKFKNKVEYISKGSFGNKNIYAKWTPISYAITYNLDGGTNINNPNTYTIEDSKISLNQPTRTGYEFEGWYTNASFVNRISEIDTSICTPVVLYAKWSLKVYKITYELEGGINSTRNVNQYTIENAFRLNEPTRSGYDFEKWVIIENDNNVLVEHEVEYIDSSLHEDITLYAKWIPIDYYISYYLYPGKYSYINPGTYNPDTETFVLVDEQREGYIFEGWYTDDRNSTKVTQIPKGSIGDISLCAKWSLEQYAIKYHLNGGTNSAYNKAYYTIEDKFLYFYDPSLRGYEFEGWYKEAEFINEIEWIDNTNLTNLDIYAKWSLDYYDISYYDGSDYIGGDEYTIYDTVEFPSLEKEGYTFAGWYLDRQFTRKYMRVNVGTTGSFKLYAKWIGNEYAIHYVLYDGMNALSNPTKYTAGVGTSKLDSPTKPGFVFAGWYSEPSYKHIVTSIDCNQTGEVTLYAKWLNTYTITYKLNGGINDASNPSLYIQTVGITSFANPTKTGYKFAGWFSNKELTNRITSISPEQYGNIVLYAKWTIIQKTKYITVGTETYLATMDYRGKCIELLLLKSKTKKKSISIDYITINGKKNRVTGIGDYAFENNQTITTVVLGAGVNSIGKNAFNGCVKLASVKGANGVKEIGKSAFGGCKALVTLPNFSKLTSIGDKAFYKCENITKITIGPSVTDIGKSSFYNCKKLKAVTIKTEKLSEKTIGNQAFRGIDPNAIVKVPKKKLKEYTKWLKKKGISGKKQIIKGQ